MYYEHQEINNHQYYHHNHGINDNITNFTPEKKQIILEHLLITKKSTEQKKNYSHVPCKFFKQGKCTAGNSCPFSHSLDFNEANKRPCKYFKFGNCKFGNKCANSHILSNEYISTSSLPTSSAINQVPSRKFSNNNNNTTITTATTTNNNTNQFFSPAPINSEPIMTNYIYQYPSYNQLIPKSSVPFTPPPFSSSSSCSSSLSCSSIDSLSSSFSNSSHTNKVMPRYLNTFHSTTHNYEYNCREDNINTNTNHTKKILTPIMFTKIEEEENIVSPLMEDMDKKDCYLNYSSILNNLEEENDQDEKEEKMQFMYQQSSFNSPTCAQYQQHFKFDDL